MPVITRCKISAVLLDYKSALIIVPSGIPWLVDRSTQHNKLVTLLEPTSSRLPVLHLSGQVAHQYTYKGNTCAMSLQACLQSDTPIHGPPAIHHEQHRYSMQNLSSNHHVLPLAGCWVSNTLSTSLLNLCAKQPLVDRVFISPTDPLESKHNQDSG